jgi:hypothetical protein
MESTGVYWIPVFQILDAHGFDVMLVNAHHVKNVPGWDHRFNSLPIPPTLIPSKLTGTTPPPANF